MPSTIGIWKSHVSKVKAPADPSQSTYLHVHQDDVKKSALLPVCARALFPIDCEICLVAKLVQSFLDNATIHWVVFGHKYTHMGRCWWTVGPVRSWALSLSLFLRLSQESGQGCRFGRDGGCFKSIWHSHRPDWSSLIRYVCLPSRSDGYLPRALEIRRIYNALRSCAWSFVAHNRCRRAMSSVKRGPTRISIVAHCALRGAIGANHVRLRDGIDKPICLTSR